MYKILVNAYSCCPNRGSEPGMAWNWISNLAKYCTVDVITSCEFKHEIETYMPTFTCKDNVCFHFIDIGDKATRMGKNQGDWRFYYYYYRWQQMACEKAHQICETKQIDILHQLNMIGYREPGFLYQIKGVPLVWGPVAGFEQMKWSFVPSLDAKEGIKYFLRNILNCMQMRISPRVRKMMKHSAVVMSATIESQLMIKKVLGYDSILTNETGSEGGVYKLHINKGGILNLIWVGKMIGRKALPIALHALGKLPEGVHYKMHILGDGDNLDQWQKLSSELGIADNCVFYGQIPRSKVLELFEDADLLLFTSLQEGTPHVVLEALSMGVPVVSHDINGQSTVLNDFSSIKIPLVNYKTSVDGFSDAIKRIYYDRDLLAELSKGATERANELSWNNKVNELIEIYQNVLVNQNLSNNHRLDE